MKKNLLSEVRELLKETGVNWWDHKAPKGAAALSYYTVFSIAPMLVLMVALAGMFLGNQAMQGHVVEEMEGLLGKDGAGLLQTMLVASSNRKGGVFATIVGIIVILIGATTVMIELQDSLNTVWRVAPRAEKVGATVKSVLRDRLLSLGLILSFGFVMLVSLGMSAGLAALGAYLRGFIPAWVIVGRILSEALSFGIIALFIALVFKILPAAKIAWRDVWIGSVLTSVLFHLGKLLIGLYIGKASVASTFGATGSLAALLVWVYYSSMILLLGAEFTRAYAERFGKGIKPDADAINAPDPQIPGAEPIGSAAREAVNKKEKASAAKLVSKISSSR